MVVALYRKYISKSVRDKIYRFCLKDILFVCRNITPLMRSKLAYYFSFVYPKTEKNQLYHFMGKYGLTSYPWSFVKEYTTLATCYFDKERNLHYVLHNEKKLFFPNSLTVDQVKNLYQSLLIEQDVRSPHRYLENDFTELKDRVLLDIGAAEGIFTLDSIEFVKHAYLFECDANWVNALNATFEPWKEKITIIPKYVSDNVTEFETTIDFCRTYWTNSALFIKMDIEGAEIRALHGAKEVLCEGDDINLSVCTYHSPLDADKISSYLSSLAYTCCFTEGYLFFNKNLNKGVLRATKSIAKKHQK